MTLASARLSQQHAARARVAAPARQRVEVALPAVAASPRSTVWLRRLGRRLALLDLMLVTAALSLALGIRFGQGVANAEIETATRLPVSSYLVLGGGLVLAWLGTLYCARTYDGRVIGVGVDEYKRVLRGSMWLWGAVAVICYAGRVEMARTVFAVAFPAGTMLLLIGRYVARKALHRARKHSENWSHRVLVVGGVKETNELVAELGREPYAGLHVIGACVPAGYEGPKPCVPVVGTLTSVAAAVAHTGADTVAVTASRGVTSSVLKRLGWELEGAGVDLVVAPVLTDVAGPRVHVRPVSGLSLLYVEQPEFSGPQWAIKEVFDRMVAFFSLLLLLPAMGLIAVMVKTTSPGPVIFRQVRIGRDGRSFTVYKFRTMVVDAENQLTGLRDRNESDGALFKLRDDPRVTAVGRVLRRFSLDELPQLVNVLNGAMSMVGPRPALPGETEQYGDAVARRLLVKPGITGLWQVSGRSDLSWEDSVRLDLYYVENWSFTADIQILWKTLYAVVGSRGAY